MVPVQLWSPHTDSCFLCHAKSGVGRPAKSTKNRGRPPGETTNTIIAHIRESAAPSVAMSVDTARICSSQVNPSHLTCAMCQCIADAPVVLACGPLACCKCLIELLLSDGPATHCPGCNTDLSSNHIEKCTDMTMEVLINSKVECHQPVPLRDVVQHETACGDGVAQLRHTAHDVTLEAVIKSPLESPLSPDEEVACTRLVKRAMRGGKQLVLKTGGQVRPKMIHNIINYNAVKYELSNHSKTEIYRVSHFTTPLFHGSVPLRRRIELRRGEEHTDRSEGNHEWGDSRCRGPACTGVDITLQTNQAQTTCRSWCGYRY